MTWKCGRVVYGAGLENRNGLMSVDGSNPSTSAINGRRVMRAAWAGVPWLRTLNARVSDSVQGAGGNRKAFAGVQTAGENPAAVHQ